MTQTTPHNSRWATLERWSPGLFALGSGMLLVAALHRGLAFALEALAFNDWIGLTGLVGRMAVVIGLAGLSTRVANQSARLGKTGRALAGLTVAFVVVLLAMAIVENLGSEPDVIAVFGLGTFALSVVTYALFGGAILRTGAYSPVIGWLLLVATIALLAVFVGQNLIPEGLIGSIVEGALFIIYAAIAYRLPREVKPA